MLKVPSTSYFRSGTKLNGDGASFMKLQQLVTVLYDSLRRFKYQDIRQLNKLTGKLISSRCWLEKLIIMSIDQIPPEILLHIGSFFTPSPLPSQFNPLGYDNKTLCSLCLVSRSFRQLFQPILIQNPRLLLPRNRDSLQKYLNLIEAVKEAGEHLEIRELNLEACTVCDSLKNLKELYRLLFTILQKTDFRRVSLCLHFLEDGELQPIFNQLFPHCEFNSSSLLTSLALKTNLKNPVIFDDLAAYLVGIYFSKLKELKLSGFKISNNWEWDQLKGREGRPRFQLENLIILGRGYEWSIDAIEGLLGIDSNFAAGGDNKTSSSSKPLLHHLVLHQCFEEISQIRTILDRFESSLLSLSATPRSSQPFFPFLVTLSPYLTRMTSLQVFNLHLANLPDTISTLVGSVLSEDFLRSLSILTVTIEPETSLSPDQQELLINEFKRWKSIMRDGRNVRWLDGQVWNSTRSLEVERNHHYKFHWDQIEQYVLVSSLARELVDICCGYSHFSLRDLTDPSPSQNEKDRRIHDQ